MLILLGRTDCVRYVGTLRHPLDFDSVTLKMEVECSSETSEQPFITRPGNPKENHQLINNRRENVKNYNTRQTAGINPLKPELNPICYLLALLGAHHFLHVSRIRVKLLTFRLLMSYIYGAPILDVSRSHTTTQHSR